MDVWLACVLLLLSVAGIVFLCRLKRRNGRKTAYTAGIVCLALLAAASACYLGVTALFVDSIP